ncbi:hypothetical protein O181_098522 [Austropuccinia psidii MF-1]|uniref:Uncharacterized protein n=1 Tax=Austropuccinia psidii MF-1 TaxID=1389203 RepID=A0A9Q3JAK3_9BASI|nr:hypothetical protein [Austropuccinia psidii MF-1]
MTDSLFMTYNSFEMAYPVLLAPNVTQPVLVMTLLPGRASRKELALALGSAGAVVEANQEPAGRTSREENEGDVVSAKWRAIGRSEFREDMLDGFLRLSWRNH